MSGATWAWENVKAKVDSGLHSHHGNSRKSGGQPYFNLKFASSTSSTAPLRRTSATSSLGPVRKSSSRVLQTSSRTHPYRVASNNNRMGSNVFSKRSLRPVSSLVRSKASSLSLLSRSSSRRTLSSSATSIHNSESKSKATVKAEIEPFTEKISKDIAAAVALIVAEYELLRDENGSSNDEEAESTTPSPKTKRPEGNKNKTGTVAPAAKANSRRSSNEKEVAGRKEIASVEPVTATATEPGPRPSPNNNGDAAAQSRTKPKPGTTSAAPAAGEQAQSSQLPGPDKVVVLENGSSSSTIGLDIQKPAAPSPSKKEIFPLPRSTAAVPMPTREAKLGGHAEVKKYLGRVQNYINLLGYHREGEPKNAINIRLSMKAQMLTAKDLIQAGHPIKCLHAVVLAVHLTNALDTVERFPIYFRSHMGDKEYKHIVLGIYCQGHYGALGISRDDGLQDKKLIYAKLSDLVFEFANSYLKSGHILNDIKVGTIITHDHTSLEKLFSKTGVVPIHEQSRTDIEANVEKIAKQLRAKMGLACLRSVGLDKHISPSTRRSRSKITVRNQSNNNVSSNLNVTNSATNNVLRSRALSVGLNLASLRVKNEDKVVPLPKSSKTTNRTKPKTSKSKKIK